MLPSQFECLDRLVAERYGVLVAEFDGYEREVVPDFRKAGAAIQKLGIEMADGELRMRSYGEGEVPPALSAADWPSLGQVGTSAQALDCLGDVIADKTIAFMREAIAEIGTPATLVFLDRHQVPKVFPTLPVPYREARAGDDESIRVRHAFGVRLSAGGSSASG